MYVSNVTIATRIRKYTKVIKEYIDTLIPELSDTWSIDERVLNVKDIEKMTNGFHGM